MLEENVDEIEIFCKHFLKNVGKYQDCPETLKSSSIYARYAIYQNSQVAGHAGPFETS